MPSKDQTRRALLNLGVRTTATAAIAGSLGSLAFAGGGPLDRAVVSLYLHGGFDSNNLLVPTDAAAYSAYARARGPLAVAQSRLLPINASRQTAALGMHPSFAELHQLYEDGALAIVANTGRLPQPSFNHTEASYAAYAYNGAVMAPWAVNIQPQLFSLNGIGILTPDRVGIQGQLSKMIAAAPRLRTPFPADSFGSGLLQVAHVLASASKLGMRRIVVSLGLGGWDMHMDQAATEPAQFSSLSRALTAFYLATQELGIADRVVTHTQTEFNRTLIPNAKGGTDHAWGGHSLVLGASVHGGDVYGHFPDDFTGKTPWTPTTSHDQIAATIAYWFGVSMGNLPTAVPGIQAYSEKTLPFLG